MHKVASLHQALPALPPAMYFVFSRAWRTVKVNCAAHGARPSLDTPRHKSQRVFGLRNHDSQRLGSKECSVRRDCGFRHRRLGGSKAGPATQKLRAFFCNGPRRPAVHTARQIRGARPGTVYLKASGINKEFNSSLLSVSAMYSPTRPIALMTLAMTRIACKRFGEVCLQRQHSPFLASTHLFARI